MTNTDLGRDAASKRATGLPLPVKVLSSARAAALCRAAFFAAVATIYLLWPNPRPDFTPFNVHDGEAYLSLSYSLSQGHGYTRNIAGATFIPHTTWPPGMAVILMPAMLFMDPPIDWGLAKLPVMLLGLGGIVLAWHLMRRLTGEPLAADFGATLMALNPYYWHFSRITLAEVPVVFWLLLALLVIDRLWANRQPRTSVVALSGIGLGLGMLIKGTLIGIAAAPLAYLIGRRRSRLPFFAHAGRLVVFGLCFAIPMAVWTARNHHIDTTHLGFDGINQVRMVLAENPTDPDSSLRNLPALTADAYDNIRWGMAPHTLRVILPFYWSAGDDHWLTAAGPVVALFVIISALILGALVRMPSVLLALVPMAAMSVVYAFGAALRFWLPVVLVAWTFAAAGLAARAIRSNVRRSIVFSAMVAIVLVQAAGLAAYIRHFETMPYHPDAHVRELADLFSQIRNRNLQMLGVYTPHHEAFYFETGLPAPMVNPALGVNPEFSHMIVREDVLSALPSGSATIMSVPPWILVSLPDPQTREDIVRAVGAIH